YFSESTLGNEAEPDKDNFLEEVLEKEIELGKDNFSEKVLENEVELESNNLPSDWREVLDNSDDSDIEWETQVSRQGKHQKTIRIIDDEDIAEKCHMWIGTITPLKFKNFVEQKLLVENGITKKKDISVKSAT
ncbi:11282_t:CDS:2, partial [Entrophospora sp. SA101]